MNVKKRTLLNNMLSRKTKWIGYNLRINCLLHDTIGQLMEVKGVGRRRTPFLDDLRNRRWCWELKEEPEDRKKCGNYSLSVEYKEEVQFIFH